MAEQLEVETKDIIALHNQGLSPSEIAAKLGTTYEVVYMRLIRAGFEPHPLLPEVPTEDIVALHNLGLSPTEIAAKLGTTYNVVYGRLIQAGLTPYAIPPSPITEEIIALHKQGLTPSEIAAKMGTTYKVVYMRLIRAGFEPHLLPEVPTEDIVALHNLGLSPTEIAARVNLSRQAIHGRLLRAGFKPVLAPRLVRAVERASDIVRLHQEGLTPKQIAERVDLKWSQIHHYLREARLSPHPSEEETQNALQGADEILRLAKVDIPRYEIAKRMGSTWPLVAEILERSSTKPVWPACDELFTWASKLLPIVGEIRSAHPNTGAILRKVEQLEKELLAINDATWIVQHRLPWTGKEADKERWCVADISQVCSNSLDYMDALKGCVKQLDVAKLPRLVEQAETCISNICNVISGAVHQVVEKPGEVVPVRMGMYQSETKAIPWGMMAEISIGDRVCDKYSGSCGPVVSIINDEVEIEPTTIKRGARGEYLEVSEPPIRAKIANLGPDHVRRYEKLGGNPMTSPRADKEEAELLKGLLPMVGLATAGILLFTLLVRTFVGRRVLPGKDGRYLVSVRYPGQWHDLREFVQPDNPDVLAVYSQYGPDPWALYDWVCKSVSYRLDLGEFWQTPSETLRGIGDCEDTSILLTSLIRAGGTPNCYVVLGNLGGYGHAWCEHNGQVMETTYTSARPVPDAQDYCPYVCFNDQEVVELWPGALGEVFSLRRSEATKLNLIAEAVA